MLKGSSRKKQFHVVANRITLSGYEYVYISIPQGDLRSDLQLLLGTFYLAVTYHAAITFHVVEIIAYCTIDMLCTHRGKYKHYHYYLKFSLFFLVVGVIKPVFLSKNVPLFRPSNV